MTARRSRFAARRKSQGFSQEALAERLAVDPKTVRRWESGESEPLPWMRKKLALHLQVSLEQLETLLEVSESPEEADERLQHALLHPGSIDLVTVERLQNQIRSLSDNYDSTPSTSLLAQAGACLGQVAFFRTYAPNTMRSELLAAEAQGATFMGQLVWDASQRRDNATANHHLEQAVSAARKLDDHVAEGQALLRKSYVALYGEKNPTVGLHLTTRAAETTSGASNVLAGLALLHKAEAHAMLGQQSDCEKTLTEADRRFDRIRSTDSALRMFSPTQHGRLAGSCYLFLDKAELAQPILEATADELRDRTKTQAIVLGNLSLAYIRQRKLDEAVGSLHRAIDLVEQTRGGGGLNIVFGACRELQPSRNIPVVQDVYDRVLALMTTT